MIHKKIKLGALLLLGIGLTAINAQTVTDIVGNVYKTEIFGTQVWMVENLKTTKFQDSTDIPMVTFNNTWAELKIPAYCWNNNDETANRNRFGSLYNWYAVNTNKLCPAGWHVPTDNDWAIFTNYLMKNGNGYEGSKINIAKSMAAISGWTTSEKTGTVGNEQASNNKSGFNGLPGGSRSFNGTFGGIGSEGAWWSSTGFSNYVAWLRCLDYRKRILYRAYLDKRFGMSVRCIKD